MTAYLAVRRLPPAHTLTWQSGTLAITRYWSLPIEQPLRYRRAEEYVAQFNELFTQAVADRLRTDHMAVTMSGGLDSTAVAAVAHDQLKKQFDPAALHAFTNVFDSLIDDDEEAYARLVAAHLDIPHHVRKIDDYTLFERWDQLDLRSSEPAIPLLAAWTYDEDKEIASQARVTLSGMGGDPLLLPEPGYLYALLAQRRFDDLRFDLGQSIQRRRIRPLYLRTYLRQRYAGRSAPPTAVRLPPWLNPDLVEAYQLPERWRIHEESTPVPHPRRPQAVSNLASPFWASLLESYDAENRTQPRETRHPFFDLRLVRFALRLSPLPWCLDKHLLRSAMQDRLPRQVVQRPKTPLSANPQRPIAPLVGPASIDRLSRSGDLVKRYGDLGQAVSLFLDPDQVDSQDYGASLRLMGLANWLDGNQR